MQYSDKNFEIVRDVCIMAYFKFVVSDEKSFWFLQNEDILWSFFQGSFRDPEW